MKVEIDLVGRFLNFIDLDIEYRAKDKYDFKDVINILLTEKQQYESLDDKDIFVVSKERCLKAVEYLESAKLRDIEFNIHRP